MGLFFIPWDIWYFILVIPAFVLSMIASSKVKSTFKKYDTLYSEKGISGYQAASMILQSNGINDIIIERARGELTDHFDPTKKVIRLSESTYDSTSVAAIGVAAHEVGHAIQHNQAYIPNKIRNVLVPMAKIGSGGGPYLAIFGIILGFPFLINLGIILFSIAVLFYLITLPVEFNASRRAMVNIRQTQILYDDELFGARRVLTAAAMTYVASLLVALASLARIILLSRGRRR